MAIANLVVVAGVLFFMTNTLDAFNYPKTLVASIGVFALLLALMVHQGYLLNKRKLHIVERVLFGMIFSTLILASFNDLSSFLTLYGSFSRANGLFAKIPLLVLAIIYFRFSDKTTINRFFQVALVLLGVEVVYGAIQLSGNDPIPWSNPYNNIFVTAGNPNFAAALFAILVVLNFRFLFLGENTLLRAMGFFAVISGIYMSYATKSVQGILTIAAAVFVLALIAILRFSSKRVQKVTLMAFSIVAALPIALGVFNVGPLRSFLFQETLSIRLHYWRVATRIIGDHPLFGVGIDRYGDFYRTYREGWFVDKYGPGLISTNAHNVALQWGTDLGVIGLLMYLTLFGLASFTYLKKANFNSSKGFTNFDFLYVSFFAFYLQSIISISQLSVTILGFALLGLVLSYWLHEGETRLTIGKSKDSPGSQKRRSASFIGFGTWWLIIVLMLTPFLSSIVRKDIELRRALQLPGIAQKVSDLSQRSSAIKKAVDPFLEDQDYVSLAIQNLFSQGNAQTGVEVAKDSTKVNPRSWVGFQSQVLAYSQSNMPQEALNAAFKTLELDPLNYNIQFNLAEQASKLGKFDLANKYARLAFESAPEGSEAYLRAQKLLESLGN
jgi:O-antigen ligase